jgi:hypothetical protein
MKNGDVFVDIEIESLKTPPKEREVALIIL